MTETVSAVDAGPRKVSRRAVVHAPASELFAMLADPHRHHEVDRSGTVRGAADGPDKLSAGDTFTVGMKQHGIPYKIKSTVTEFEQDRLIEWRHPAGHRWRWEFEQIEPGVTQVTETFDYSTAKAPAVLQLFRAPKQNTAGITKTLEGLQARYAH